MNDLVPCPSCRRHVRKHESACPFCSTELSLAHLPPPVLPRSRLGRAATFTFGATLAGAALIACGGESEEGKRGGGGESAGGSAGQAGSATGGSAMGGNIAQPYGVPPLGGAGFGNFAGSGGQSTAGTGGQTTAGSGGQSAGAGGQSNAGNGGQGGGVAPPYGIPPPEGGGPIYGAAPAD
jgi:hypothetical protein